VARIGLSPETVRNLEDRLHAQHARPCGAPRESREIRLTSSYASAGSISQESGSRLLFISVRPASVFANGHPRLRCCRVRRPCLVTEMSSPSQIPVPVDLHLCETPERPRRSYLPSNAASRTKDRVLSEIASAQRINGIETETSHLFGLRSLV
jgi:hypothetical protein